MNSDFALKKNHIIFNILLLFDHFLIYITRINEILGEFWILVLSHVQDNIYIREAAKKSFFFSGPTTKTGGRGGKGLTTKKKNFFLYIYIFYKIAIAQKLWRKFVWSKSVSGYFKTKEIKTEKKVPMTTKPRGGGG